MLTFDSVLRGINKHTEYSAKRLMFLVLGFVFFGASLTLLVGLTATRLIPRLPNTVYIPIGYFMLVIISFTLKGIKNNKDTFDTVHRWRVVILVLSIITIIFSGVIIFLF